MGQASHAESMMKMMRKRHPTPCIASFKALDCISFQCTMQGAASPLANLPGASENYQKASKDQSCLPMWASDIVHILKLGR